MTQSNVLTFRSTKTAAVREGKHPENIWVFFFRYPRYDSGPTDINLVISLASFLMHGAVAENPIRSQLQKQ